MPISGTFGHALSIYKAFAKLKMQRKRKRKIKDTGHVKLEPYRHAHHNDSIHIFTAFLDRVIMNQNKESDSPKKKKKEKVKANSTPLYTFHPLYHNSGI